MQQCLPSLFGIVALETDFFRPGGKLGLETFSIPGYKLHALSYLLPHPKRRGGGGKERIYTFSLLKNANMQ